MSACWESVHILLGWDHCQDIPSFRISVDALKLSQWFTDEAFLKAEAKTQELSSVIVVRWSRLSSIQDTVWVKQVSLRGATWIDYYKIEPCL